ncbi:NAD(P)H-hydrate dehydratase [Euhalothece natronophila Z-M001]|uniref:Bifunctional NAD(P)H-hydrate repair enzyme n=1 Tax=Euhalothece natronophila Z-M001 TaxID=522448 RepID=A0A5B8NLE2_9CHRO|nr:NAD(P)H-hydrate dehydratase [Euhalothece natronophila]QDZ40082.1 NAD(P)H-hydrate dehydratase [Euhalothece natronophila Z-M001]
MNHYSTSSIEHFVVSARQMAAIEQRIFDLGMPVAALMEKVAGLITQRLIDLFKGVSKVGIIVGPGHNGGDAAVVARELHLKGYNVAIYRPLNKGKELTQAHLDYVKSLGVTITNHLGELESCEVIVDGLFGFGMTRSLDGELANAVKTINQWSIPVVSIDLPSGIHTDTGEVLGSAIAADYTFCLGLWKLAFFQDTALPYLGKPTLIDFGIPLADVEAVVKESTVVKRMSANLARSLLPLPRPLVTHKYKQGHLLIIAGSYQYAGSVILAGLGARKSGVGMVSIAAPASLKPMLVTHLPEALIIDCPETTEGAIAELPSVATQWEKYNAVAVGPGLTLDAQSLLSPILDAPIPLILDADGLNLLAQMNPEKTLKSRHQTTILTPHPGEFRRLFPNLDATDTITKVQTVAKASNSCILIKGARSAIAGNNQETWVIPESTPALARGGSGDVLTGLLSGLVAQSHPQKLSPTTITAIAATWHAQAGIMASQQQSELGVDAFTLTQYLTQFVMGNQFDT